MAPTRKTRKKTTANRREKVLEAARVLFFEKGYRGATMEQIARRAGYSKRSVYLDFKNKDDLFMSVCAIGMELLVEKMQMIPVQGISIEDFVEAFLNVLTEFADRHERYLRMFTVEATPDIVVNCSEKVRKQVTGLEQEGYSIVVAQIKRGIREKSISATNPMEAAGVFLGSVTGIILLSLGGSQTIFSRKTLDAMAKSTGRLLLSSLSQPC